MSAKSFRVILFFLIASGLFSWNYFPANSVAQASSGEAYPGINTPALGIGPIFTQSIDPSGKLLISSWLDPDGSDNDRYVWDNFILQTTETITEIDWYGGYDPTRSGAGGPVLDFRVSIYPSIAAGTEPAVANPPLVQYLTGGNAGQAPIGMVGGTAMYAYAFGLPVEFIASAGVKYWVQIEAFQQGSIPDWGIAVGTGGDVSHYLRESGAGGDIRYHFASGDAAFTLLGPIPVIEPRTFIYLPVLVR